MKNTRAGLLCVVLLMLLLSISTVYSQQSSVSDQQIINNLNQLRMELLQKLIATIPVKVQFSMNEAAAVQNCINKGVLRSCTYAFKTGEVLSETKDERGYLINDSFQDPANHVVLNTEYTLYNRPLCYTLIDTMKQVGIKVCNSCQNNTTDILWTNQTVRDYKTGDTLIVTLDCCGNSISTKYEKLPGLAFAQMLDPALSKVDVIDTCQVNKLTEIRAGP